MTKLILTRHGHVDGISPERFRGRADIALTELGQAQAKAVAARIATAWKPSAIYTSPMKRCIATGAEIAEACRVAAQILGDLNDLDYGRWQWRTQDEVRAVWPDLLALWHGAPQLVRFPDGDSLQDLVRRAGDALRAVLLRHAGDAEVVVLVGHDSVNRALLLQLLDQPLSAYWRMAQSPCALNEIDILNGRIRVMRMNETAHLDGIG
jgi:phosphoserine phosphatase